MWVGGCLPSLLSWEPGSPFRLRITRPLHPQVFPSAKGSLRQRPPRRVILPGALEPLQFWGGGWGDSVSQTPYQGQSLGQRGHHQLPVLVHDVKSQGLADFLDGAAPKLWAEATGGQGWECPGAPLPSENLADCRTCQWGWGTVGPEGPGDATPSDSGPREDCHARGCNRKPGRKRQPPPRDPLLIPKWMSPRTAPRSQVSPLNGPRKSSSKLQLNPPPTGSNMEM